MNKFANLPALTDDERALIDHVSRWGSDGYPIERFLSAGGWSWGPWRSVKGSPVIFKTRRETTENFETYYETLLERLGEEARLRAEEEECPECKGTGYEDGDEDPEAVNGCAYCGATGEVSK